jgi:CrcB protein
MQKWLFLLGGGMIGTAGRHLLSGLVHRWTGPGFPFGTLVVNTLGCLIIGFLGTIAEHRLALTHESRLFWFAGLLGAFTTFSALIYESWRLLQAGEPLLAGANILTSIGFGLAALWAGHLAASSL